MWNDPCQHSIQDLVKRRHFFSMYRGLRGVFALNYDGKLQTSGNMNGRSEFASVLQQTAIGRPDGQKLAMNQF